MFISVSIPQNQSFGPIFPLKLNSNLSSDILVSTRYKECLKWLNSAIQFNTLNEILRVGDLKFLIL